MWIKVKPWELSEHYVLYANIRLINQRMHGVRLFPQLASFLRREKFLPTMSPALSILERIHQTWFHSHQTHLSRPGHHLIQDVWDYVRYVYFSLGHFAFACFVWFLLSVSCTDQHKSLLQVFWAWHPQVRFLVCAAQNQNTTPAVQAVPVVSDRDIFDRKTALLNNMWSTWIKCMLWQ